MQGGGDNAATAMKSVIVDPGAYDWEGDAPLNRPRPTTIIYEMHVGGFTRHASAGVPDGKRGTYAGLIDKIPYLQELGIIAVELLPVFRFNAQDLPLGLVNYWGYAPVSFFAPHQAYSSRRDRGDSEAGTYFLPDSQRLLGIAFMSCRCRAAVPRLPGEDGLTPPSMHPTTLSSGRPLLDLRQFLQDGIAFSGRALCECRPSHSVTPLLR